MPVLTGISPAAAVPGHALLLSLLSLWIPVLSSSMFPDWTNDDLGILVWLLALVPAFLLSFHRGWRGASLALAAAMAAFSVAQVIVLITGAAAPHPAVMVAGIGILVTVCLGSGWLSARFRRSLQRAEELALTDVGTGLPNRRHTMLHLQRAFAAAERGLQLCVVIFDLDHFKRINDRFSHHTGDIVLKAFGRHLAAETREMNLSGRFGGEEFVAVLDGVDAAGAEAFADRVRARFSADMAGQPWGRITASAGVAQYEAGMASPEVLVAAADQALYRAKARGRDCTVALGRVDAAAAPALRIPAGTDHSDHTGHGEIILVVDDDAAVLRVLMRTLKLRGYNPLGASDPQQALAIALGLSEPVDLMIVDVIMPGMSGFRLVEMIAERQTAPRVLYISGYGRDDVDWTGVPGEVRAFLPKPITIERLLESVHAALFAPLPVQRPAVAVPAADDAMAVSDALRTVIAAQSAQLEDAYEEMLYRLAWATEFRDDMTGEHAQRVGWLAGRMAEAIGLDAEDAAVIERAAPLHDVGKIAVPDAILHKPGPLTPVERVIMQTHCLAGARILAGSRNRIVQIAELIALSHHERWDGRGYPNGIAGTDIPLPARITAVADTYDALTHIRPYRRQLRSAEALAQIAADAGTHFDAEIVQALVNLHTGGMLDTIDDAAVIGAACSGATVPPLALAART